MRRSVRVSFRFHRYDLSAMSAAKRVRRRAGRRLTNNSSSSLKSLLGDGLGIAGTGEWFHSSLQSVSDGWRRFNKFGRDNKKADKCSTWYVPPTNGCHRLSSFPLIRSRAFNLSLIRV